MIFQCLGITGAILLFYSFMAFAFTQTSAIFTWILLGSGIVSLMTFIIMAVSRFWQKLIILFCALNALWVIYYGGYAWHPVAVGIICAAIIAVIAWVIRKTANKAELMMAIILPVGFTAAHLVFHEKEWINKITLAALVVFNLLFLLVAKTFLKEMFKNRSMRHGTSAAIYSIVILFIVIVVNIGSQDFNKQFDFTAERVNTLTPQTLKVLDSLQSTVKITAFFEGRGDEGAQIKGVAKNILERYKAASKKIEVQFADPDKEKLLANEKHAGDGDIVIEYNGQSNILREVSEQGVTQGILKVIRTNTPVICFTSGHGEMGLDDSEELVRSLSILKASLSNEGYQPKTLPQLSDSIPEECSVVVIPSPQQRFPDSEVALFGKYLDQGGKLIAMLDPLIPNTKVEQSNVKISPSGFEALMKKWGVKLGNDLMLEKHLEQFQGEIIDLSVRAYNYGNHPIVDSLKEKQTYFSTVQSVQALDDFSGTSYELIQSMGNKKSWAETNVSLLIKEKHAEPDGADIMGPVTIAMAVEKEGPKKTQLIVFGDGDFASNGLIATYQYNYDLFLNSLNWMSGDVQNISIRPKKMQTSAIELSAEESNTILYLAIITLPMVVLIFGMNLWWYRRRRG